MNRRLLAGAPVVVATVALLVALGAPTSARPPAGPDTSATPGSRTNRAGAGVDRPVPPEPGPGGPNLHRHPTGTKAGASDGALRRAQDALGAGRRPAAADGVRTAGSRLKVEVVGTLGVTATSTLVTDLGGQVTGHAGDSLVEAWLPQDRVAALEATTGISYVRTSRDINEPTDGSARLLRALATGTYGGEQVEKTAAAPWHDAGYTGAGVKVGIVDFFGGSAWDAAANAGELPAIGGRFCRVGGQDCLVDFWSSTSTHGPAVAEIIKDVAPGATVYLASVGTVSDLQAAVDWFSANGVRIISRSLTAPFDGPGNGTGPMADVINDAVAKGITWVNAAGNTAGNQTGVGSYWRGSWNDPDGNGWLNFSGSNEYLPFACGAINGVRWSDWGPAATDYDVYVYDSSLTLVGSYETNQPQNPPIEYPDCAQPGKLYYLSIAVFAAGNGTAGDTLEFMLNNGLVLGNNSSNPYSASGPAADSASPGALAVGAVDPWNGTVAADYSADGPTNDGRMKPDLSAVSCGSSFSDSPDCFNGTSAATPAVAGAAALVLSRWPSMTPSEVRSYLMANAVVDRGAPGWDNLYGAGELRLPDPSATPVPPSPPPAPAPNALPFGDIVLSLVDGRKYGLLAWAVDPETGMSPRLQVCMDGVGCGIYNWNYTWPQLPARSGTNSTQAFVYLALPPSGTRNVCVDAQDPQQGQWVRIGCRSITVK